VRTVKILLVFAVFFLLLASFAVADTKISVKAVEDTFAPGEEGIYELTIKNENSFTQTYTLFSLTGGSDWAVNPRPLSDNVIENVAPGESYTTTISVIPLNEDLKPSRYNLVMQIDGVDGSKQEATFTVFLESISLANYLPAFNVEVDANNLVLPSESQPILVHLENRNLRDLTDMVLEVRSELPAYNHDVEVALDPMGSKTLSFTATVDEYQQPKDYLVYYKFKVEDEIVKIVEERVTVATLTPDFAYEVTEESVYLKKFQTFVLENDGNVENTQTFLYPVHPFTALFIKSDAKVVSVSGNRYVSWEVSLAPGDTTTLTATYNFRILAYLGIAFLLFLLFYYVVRSPLIIHKGAVTSVGKEGALHEIKIALDVKNRGKKTVKNLKIVEFIPGIADLDKRLELGTLKPDRVVSNKGGTKVIWKIAELNPLEHRIITYKIRNKLNVLGTFKLPRAIIEFHKNSRGKIKKAYSNIFKLDASRAGKQE